MKWGISIIYITKIYFNYFLHHFLKHYCIIDNMNQLQRLKQLISKENIKQVG